MRRIAACLLLLAALAAPAGAAELSLDAVRRLELARLDLLRGQALAAGELEERAVLVTFFASWCPPCRAEFRDLARLHDAYRDRGLRIVAVNLYETWGNYSDEGKLLAFLEASDPPFTVLRGEARTAGLFGQVRRLPTVWVFATDSRPTLHFVHAQDGETARASYGELAAAVEAALGPPE